ncbi:hypothetical protein IWX92DRAFT_229954 [Phyllosticta citricarpa]
MTHLLRISGTKQDDLKGEEVFQIAPFNPIKVIVFFIIVVVVVFVSVFVSVILPVLPVVFLVFLVISIKFEAMRIKLRQGHCDRGKNEESELNGIDQWIFFSWLHHQACPPQDDIEDLDEAPSDPAFVVPSRGVIGSRPESEHSVGPPWKFCCRLHCFLEGSLYRVVHCRRVVAVELRVFGSAMPAGRGWIHGRGGTTVD